MSFMNKVGSMLNKKVGNKKGEPNSYKPAGVHVLGEDNFTEENLMMNEEAMEEDNYNNIVKQNTNPGSISSDILPTVTKKKAVSSSMTEILGLSKQNQPPQKKISKAADDSEFMKGFTLINGEKKIHSDKCNIKIDKELIPCKALLTNYRVYLLPDFNKKVGDFSYYNYFPEKFFSLLIHKIEKAVKTSNEKSFIFSIEIHMKDQRIITIVFKNNSGDSFLDRLNGLLSLKEKPSYANLAFEYRKNHPIYKKNNFEDGWNLYNPEKEYERQGITNLDYEVKRNKLFRRTKLNENYSLCQSYPKFLITVGEITDSDYKSSSEFRTKNRLPTLAYYHSFTKGTIWRSAQTKSGLTGNRNRYDEDLLMDIAKISDSKKAYIYDCRPYLSAMANKIKGAGFENVENYPGAEIIFCEIDHIHSARNALNKIYSMLKSNNFNQDKKFFSNFESSGWPNFIFGIIRASVNIASSIRHGYSVLIHCSDGWDRCSQLTSFSELLIDPYFRTIKGYMTLIEKDFVSFGHQFRIRNGYYSKEENNENKTSPILLQFLDATHQLLVQYPMYFEFNMKFLLFIANSINCGLYGTFLYNNEKEREQKNVKDKTMSCWTEILNNINQYKNPFYEIKTKKDYFFTPIFPFNRIRLWEEFFFPFTQININLSYDNYINRFSDNFYYNIFGQMKQKTKIISNVMFIDKEKENYEKNSEKLKKENQKLKEALAELTINNNVNKEIYEKLSNETINILKNLAKEHHGEIELNSELNQYTFKQIKIQEEEVNANPENNIKKEENKIIEEEKMIDSNINKSSKIGKDKIAMFFGTSKITNEKKNVINSNIEKVESNNEEKISKEEKEEKKENIEEKENLENNLKIENTLKEENKKEEEINENLNIEENNMKVNSNVDNNVIEENNNNQQNNLIENNQNLKNDEKQTENEENEVNKEKEIIDGNKNSSENENNQINNNLENENENLQDKEDKNECNIDKEVDENKQDKENLEEKDDKNECNIDKEIDRDKENENNLK